MAELKIDITKVVEGTIEKIKAEGYTVSKWIKCSEQLPTTRQTILIYDEYEGVCAGYYDSDYAKFRAVDDIFRSLNVTHWQPLPEPPKESERHDD